jgi:mono/diheme cytochrome c family protein
MKPIAIVSSLFLAACTMQPGAMSVSPAQMVVVHGASRLTNGNADEGRKLFTKLRCDSCHAVSGSAAKVPHPLPDLSAQPPEAVAERIVQRTEIAPEALFDEMAMAGAASNMTHEELAHIVAYLRNPTRR